VPDAAAPDLAVVPEDFPALPVEPHPAATRARAAAEPTAATTRRLLLGDLINWASLACNSM
jgi:hypothetical protein